MTITLKSFASGDNPSPWLETRTAANISAATEFSVAGRKDMQQHYGLDVKATVTMDMKNN